MRTGVVRVLLVLLTALGSEQVGNFESPSAVPFQQQETQLPEALLEQLPDEVKAGQLFILRAGPEHCGALSEHVARRHPGGLWLEGWPAADFLATLNTCRRLSRLPLFTGASPGLVLNEQIAGAPPFLGRASFRALADDSLRHAIHDLYLRQLHTAGLNFRLGIDAGDDQEMATLPRYHAGRLLTAAGRLEQLPVDTLPGGAVSPLRKLAALGLGGVIVDYHLARTRPAGAADGWLARRLAEEWGYDGLLITELPAGADPMPLLRAGVDLLITEEAGRPQEIVARALTTGRLDRAQVDQKVYKILKAKQWMRDGLLPPVRAGEPRPLQASIGGAWMRPAPATAAAPDSALIEHFSPRRWDYFTYRMFEKTVTLVHNRKQLLPFTDLSTRSFRLVQLSDRPFRHFREYFNRYADASVLLQPPASDGTLPPLATDFAEGETKVIVLDTQRVIWKRDLPFIQSVQELARRGDVVMVNFGDPQNLQFFDTTLTVVQIYERNEVTETTAAQLLFGALQAEGKLPVTVNRYFPAGAAAATPVIRLKYGRPEEAGVAPEKLVGIDAIARTAVQDGATPGCQVVVAKDGKVIYHKAFGWHTYRREKEVAEDHLYDLASVTKVAATILSTMALYEAGALRIDDRLSEVMPCDPGAAIGRIPLRQLMTHESGLQPHMPVLPYLLYRDVPNAGCDSFFCNKPSYQYALQVADRFYFDKRYKDSIWAAVNELPVGRRGRYRYSDVNFVLMQRVVETQSRMPLDHFVAQRFFRPLGLRRTTFRPQQKRTLEEIIPTQHDHRWRKQLVHGFVHDETAAIFGGVAGHAGLFSTAEELTVLFQMLLNGGAYGGRRYLQPETIQLFTSRQGDHRGLGFDKPSSRYYKAMAADAPAATFGHTGFTGACAWVDPDNGLIYVFLSNRIHPDVKNRQLFRNKVRERIHQVVYDALDTYQPEPLETEPMLKGG